MELKSASEVNNMAEQELKTSIMTAFVQHGVTDADQIAAARQAIIEMIPESSKPSYASEDAMILAGLEAYFASNAGGGKTTPTSQQASSLPDVGNEDPAAREAIVKSIKDSERSRMEISSKTKITKVLFDKVPPAQLVKGGITKAKFDQAQVKVLEKYAPEAGKEGHIDPNMEEDVKAWKLLKEKIAAGEELELHLSENFGTPIGVELSTPAQVHGKEGQDKPSLTKKELTTFLTHSAFGLIATDNDSKLGARLQITQKKSNKGDKKLQKSSGLGTPAAKIAGVKEAIQANAYDVTSEFDDSRTDEVKMTVTSEISFRVLSKRKKNEGTVNEQPIYRTVRARTQVPAKAVKRKPAYIDTFGTCEISRNLVTLPMSDSERQKVAKTLQSANLAIAQRTELQESFGLSAQDILGDLTSVKAEGSNATFG